MKPSELDGQRVVHVDGGGLVHRGAVVGQSDDESKVYVQSDHPNLKPSAQGWDFSVDRGLVPVLLRNAKATATPREKYTQAEAGYTDHASNPNEQCKRCQHFRPSGHCQLVQGTIDPEGWCKYFENKSELVKYNPAQPRDEHGRFVSSGDRAGNGSDPGKPRESLSEQAARHQREMNALYDRHTREIDESQGRQSELRNQKAEIDQKLRNIPLTDPLSLRASTDPEIQAANQALADKTTEIDARTRAARAAWQQQYRETHGGREPSPFDSEARESLNTVEKPFAEERNAAQAEYDNRIGALKERYAGQRSELQRQRDQIDRQINSESSEQFRRQQTEKEQLSATQRDERNELLQRQRTEQLTQRAAMNANAGAGGGTRNGVRIGNPTSEEWSEDRTEGIVRGMSNEEFEQRTGYSVHDFLGASGLREIDPDEVERQTSRIDTQITPTFDEDGNLSSVRVDATNQEPWKSPNYFTVDRTFHFEDGKPDYIHNNYFLLPDSMQGGGIGARALYSQVETAADMGFERIDTLAGKSEKMNGYITWPKLGYDSDVRGRDGEREPLSDIMATPEGRAWWEAHGYQTEMTFGLTEGSYSRTHLDTYVRRRFGGG